MSVSIFSRSTAALSHIQRASVGTFRCSCRSVLSKKTYTLYYFPYSNKRFRDKGKVSRLKKGNPSAKIKVSTFYNPIILVRRFTYFLILSNSLFLSRLLSNRRSVTAMLTSTARTPRIVDSNPAQVTFPFFHVLCCVGKRLAMGRSPVQGSQQTSKFKIPNPETGDPGPNWPIAPQRYVHTYTHTYIHTYAHTYIHTHTINTHTYTHNIQ